MVRPSIVIGHGTVRQDSISHQHSRSDLGAQPPWPEAERINMCAPLTRGQALVQLPEPMDGSKNPASSRSAITAALIAS